VKFFTKSRASEVQKSRPQIRQKGLTPTF